MVDVIGRLAPVTAPLPLPPPLWFQGAGNREEEEEETSSNPW